MEEIYKQLVLSWREAFERLTPDERNCVSSLDDFRAPCQLEVILLENRQLRIIDQLWIISHFKNEPDLTIIIHGPISSVDATSKLPEISESKRLERSLPEKTMFLGAKTYRDLMEGHLLRLTESFRSISLQKLWSRQLPKGSSSGLIGSKMRLSEEASTWEFHGALNSRAIGVIINSIMNAAKKEARAKGQAKPAVEAIKRKDINEIKAKGTYIYPHVWVGSKLEHSFKDDLNEKMYARQRLHIGFAETIVFEKVGNIHGLVTKEGLVAVTVEDNIAALQILNSFMSLLTLRGIPALAMRENELADLTLDPNTGKILGSQTPMTLPRMALADPLFVRPRWQEERMSVLQVDFVKEIWKEIARITKDHTSLDLLQIFGEVYTHFQRGEYPQTVLLAWTLVERWYASIREQARRPEKLKKGSRLHRVVEFDMLRTLEAEALIDSELASKMYQLRQLRGQVVHSFRTVNKEEAQTALTIATTILQGIKG